MRKIVQLIGFLWVGICVLAGIWLGISQAFLHGGGILFASGFGDIWILALLASPGYLLYVWGKPSGEPNA